MTSLGALWDGGNSFAAAVNASGQACGYATSTDYVGHAAIYTEGGIVDLRALRDDFLVSQCTGINPAGHVAGDDDGGDCMHHAFFFANGRFRSSTPEPPPMA